MNAHPYPATYPVIPLDAAPNLEIQVPGSKSITNRAMVLAALARHEITLTGALQSEDTEVMVDCLRRLGFTVQADWDHARVVVSTPDPSRIIPRSEADLFVGNSGTTVRFLTALLPLGQGEYRLDGIARMRERPIRDLIDALSQLGVDVVSEAGTGCPPVRIRAHGLAGGQASVRADVSSQFLSGLLICTPFASGETTLRIEGPTVSEPYIAMSLAMLRDFGLTVDSSNPGVYRIPGKQSHAITEYAIEPDASSASYFWATAAITGGRVTVRGLTRKSLQGDVAFVDLLEQMGCRVEECSEGITVHGRRLHGIDVDMNAVSDTVMTLGAVAMFAEGPTTIRNVGHIRHKETDRIAALAAELRKLGAEVEERSDGLRIVPPKAIQGCAVDTYNDHRMAMSLALVGLRVSGVIINDPGCVAKTYPGFWSDFEVLRGED